MEFNLNNVIANRDSKTVYRDNDKTIKLFVENYSKAGILNEALNQARVEEATDLSITKLVTILKIQNRWALVSEFIEGKTLEELMNENPEKQDEYLELFVKIQLEILSKKVPLLSTIKDKYKRKLTNAKNIDENIRYELLQRLEGMKNHTKLCHGDFNPSNIIIKENGDYSIIDWAHATQGNSSADVARTYLIFSIQGQTELAEKYLNLFCERSNINKSNIQRWIPIVAAIEMTKEKEEKQELLRKWIDIVEYQ